MAKKKPAAEGAAPAKSKLGLIIIVVVLLALLGGGGYFLMMRKGAKAAVPEKPKVILATADLYLPLEPPFVVNFKDGETLRYLQVGVTLMSRDQAALDAAKAADPVIRNALVGLFSNQDYTIISTAAGRQKLQAQALASVRKIVKDRLGRPGIDALYFTSFVMQ